VRVLLRDGAFVHAFARFSDGNTVWLASPDDPVDPERASFIGAVSQCAISSARHNAVIVSMGLGITGDGCTGVWESSRDAIVSDIGKLPPAPQGYGNRARAPAAAAAKPSRTQASRGELELLRAAVEDGALSLTRNQTAQVNTLLRGYGEPPLTPPAV
jgi:hypothetical protein